MSQAYEHGEDDDCDEVDLGGVGEKFLELLACEAGLTPNVAGRDRGGWDIHLKLPARGDDRPGGSVDRRLGETSCFVQVKASHAVAPKPRIKLSNWERMAKDPTPFFVLVVRVDRETRKVNRAWLVHVGQAVIRDVLATLRALPATETSRLHRHRMSVPMADAAELTDLEGRELRSQLAHFIGPSAPAYAARKRGWVEESGFEQQPLSLTLSLEGPHAESWQRLADLAAGEEQVLQAAVAAVEEERFGIRRPLDPAAFTDVRLQHSGAAGGLPCTVEITDGGRTQMSLVSATWFDSAAALPNLPIEYRKIVVRSPFAKFAITFSAAGTATLRWMASLPPSAAPVTLRDARSCAHGVRVLGGAGPAGRVVFRVEDFDLAFDFPGQEVAPAVRRYAELLGTAALVGGAHGLPEIWEIVPEDLEDHIEALLVAAVPHHRGRKEGHARVWLSPEQTAPRPAVAAIVSTDILPFGARVLVLATAFVGVPRWGDAGGADGLVSMEVAVSTARGAGHTWAARGTEEGALHAMATELVTVARSSLLAEGIPFVSTPSRPGARRSLPPAGMPLRDGGD